jgi:hypothetical protein
MGLHSTGVTAEEYLDFHCRGGPRLESLPKES